jgi:hypothetical protein
LYVINCLFSIVPVLAYWGVQLPDSVQVPLVIALLVIPVVSTVLLLLTKHSVFDPADPTIKPDEKEKIGVRDDTSEKSTVPDVAPTFGIGGTVRGERAPKAAVLRKVRLQAKQAGYDPGCPGIDRNVPEGFMEPIDEFEVAETHAPGFTVPQNRICYYATQMYADLDLIIDTVTVEFLSTALHWGMLFGAAALGWYIGAVQAIAEARMIKTFDCG